MTIIIFTQQGSTYRFEDVENLNTNGTNIMFDYKGKITGTNNKAFFGHKNVAGYVILGK